MSDHKRATPVAPFLASSTIQLPAKSDKELTQETSKLKDEASFAGKDLVFGTLLGAALGIGFMLLHRRNR